MAAYMWDTKVYPAEMFVESCGAILFDLSASGGEVVVPGKGGDDGAPAAAAVQKKKKKVCLLHYLAMDQWLLPKGRRNCRETRQAAAVREVREESGYACRLRPVTMPTRAPSVLEAADVKDFARTYSGLTEPFMLEVRDLGQGEGEGVKLVWWFVAEVLKRPSSLSSSSSSSPPSSASQNGAGGGAEGDSNEDDDDDDDDGCQRDGEPEVHFASAFFDCDAALKKLTFQKDREVLRRAIDLVETSDWDWSD